MRPGGRTRNWKRIVAVGITASLLVAACGDGDDVSEPSNDTATSVPASSAEPGTTTAVPRTTERPTTTIGPTTTVLPTTVAPTTVAPTTTIAPTTTTAATTTTVGPPFVGGTEPVSGARVGPVALLTDLRVARHAGFDRVVLEFEDARPAYQVGYADPPFTDVPGDIVGVAGNAFLTVWATGATTSDWEASTDGNLVQTFTGPDRLRTGTTNITEVLFVTDFESESEFIIGLAEVTPFRVLELSDPYRLVIDVRHGTTAASSVATQWVSGTGTGFGWLTDARLAGGVGVDRFVLEFSPDHRPEPDAPAPGLPGYDVHYVTGPFPGCAPAGEVPVAGSAFVLVDLHRARGIDWTYDGPDRLAADTTNVVEAVLVNDCNWLQWVIGVDHAADVTVLQLEDPPRLVVDIGHE